jgi:nicotinate-nucleotide--dimethylbenzimidazole phosphoribosyltransferase
VESDLLWPRPVPTVGDRTSAADRAADPAGWAFADDERDALARIMAARRDIRRFRPDPVPDGLLGRLLAAAHLAPSVGHSQPWRLVVVRDPATRAVAARLADRSRLEQARLMEAEAGRHLLDLDLEGIREAPLGVVVCCDRRVPPAGVLGRATFPDADMWSCACAIQNIWLAARAEGLGVGWVTLFRPADLAALVGAPPGVETLGWLCVGWPDERPPDPGLQRRGWSTRQPLEEVVIEERWPAEAGGPPPPTSRLAPPAPAAVVAAHDTGDAILTPPGSLGILDRAVDRLLAARPGGAGRAHLVLAAADHPVAAHGVSAFSTDVTRSVVEASAAGISVGAVAAAASGLDLMVVDAGVDGGPVPGTHPLRPRGPKGDLVGAPALHRADAERLVEGGAQLAASLCAGGTGLIALGEVGVGNTTVAAALAAALLGEDPARLVGLGAGSDHAILTVKRGVVSAALERVAPGASRPGAGEVRAGAGEVRAGAGEVMDLLAALGGGEIAVLTGVVLGAARAGAVLVLDGMATSVAALAAVRMEPAAAAHLVAGQRSREPGHAPVLEALGLEPLLDLRLRAGEGVGAALAVGMLTAALAVRRSSARTG